MTPIRILVADDHPVYRDGIATHLDAMPGMDVVAVASSGPEALNAIVRTRPDVAVLDLKLPGMDGIAVIEALVQHDVPTRCVIVSAFEDSATVFRAFASGARAYLMKIVSAEEVASTVQAVAAGKAVIPEALQGGLTTELTRWRYASPDAIRLTARELDVLRLAAEGLPIKAIASELFVGVTTVKTHLHRAYDKLGVNDRAAAIAVAMRRGFLD